MIYLPKRGVFVHIPRTSGNSITSAIATATAGRNIDCLLSTIGNGYAVKAGLRRHATAAQIKNFVPDWDDIYKFTVDRPTEDRLQSIFRLIERDIREGVHNDPTCTEGWKELLLNPNHREIVRNRHEDQDTDWYTLGNDGEDLGVERIPYRELNDRWPDICDKLGIPRCELPHFNKA